MMGPPKKRSQNDGVMHINALSQATVSKSQTSLKTPPAGSNNRSTTKEACNDSVSETKTKSPPFASDTMPCTTDSPCNLASTKEKHTNHEAMNMAAREEQGARNWKTSEVPAAMIEYGKKMNEQQEKWKKESIYLAENIFPGNPFDQDRVSEKYGELCYKVRLASAKLFGNNCDIERKTKEVETKTQQLDEWRSKAPNNPNDEERVREIIEKLSTDINSISDTLSGFKDEVKEYLLGVEEANRGFDEWRSKARRALAERQAQVNS